MSTKILPKELTTVKYDRSSRQWQAVNGRVWSWPAGAAGKRQAQLYALEADVPQVAEEIKAIIANIQAYNPNSTQAEAVTRRAIRAGFILRDGKMLPPRAFDAHGSYVNELARIKSSSMAWDDGTAIEYAITQVSNNMCWCECPDFQDDAPYLPSGQQACKHILTVLIADALDYDPNEPPAPRTIKSTALDDAIIQAETASHQLSMLLHEMRMLKKNLTPDGVGILIETLHPYSNTSGKICFSFEPNVDGIYNDIEAANPTE